jgi:hypothetical protein|tara:strand:+ start:3206 stop:3313 length:108 start_codon:yes stop_codon:yes gene_type:complete
MKREGWSRSLINNIPVAARKNKETSEVIQKLSLEK